jgi:predicted phage replisome organizer
MAEYRKDKYYWLKLKRDFFKRHDIRIVEAMDNGKDYILFYMKLLLESIDHNGALRFNETVPYSEKMLAVVTDTNIDIVRSAMKIFIELKMIEVLDDDTIFMNEVKNMVGSSTVGAEKKRLQRQRRAVKKLPEGQNADNCPPKIEKEKEKEKEKEEEVVVNGDGNDDNAAFSDDDKLQVFKGVVMFSENQLAHLLKIMELEVFDDYVARLDRYIMENGSNIKSHYATILKWYKEDCAVKV